MHTQTHTHKQPASLVTLHKLRWSSQQMNIPDEFPSPKVIQVLPFPIVYRILRTGLNISTSQMLPKYESS